jgi:hypothetical protein
VWHKRTTAGSMNNNNERKRFGRVSLRFSHCSFTQDKTYPHMSVDIYVSRTTATYNNFAKKVSCIMRSLQCLIFSVHKTLWTITDFSVMTVLVVSIDSVPALLPIYILSSFIPRNKIFAVMSNKSIGLFRIYLTVEFLYAVERNNAEYSLFLSVVEHEVRVFK